VQYIVLRLSSLKREQYQKIKPVPNFKLLKKKKMLLDQNEQLLKQKLIAKTVEIFKISPII
jgi:hypothetical protein